MANKRISRSRKRELEAPDEFISFTGRLLKSAVENKQKLIGIGCVIVVVILSIAGFRYFSIQMEQKALHQLQAGLDKLKSMQKEGGSEEIRLEISNDFETVLKEYPGRKAARIARVLLADMARDAGEYDSAVSLYRRALEDFDTDPFYKALILRGLAQAFELGGDDENAVKYLEEIHSGPDAGFDDEVLYNLGRMASKSGMKDKETEYFRQILESHPDSLYADMIKEKVKGPVPGS